MALDVTVRARVDSKLKEEVEEIGETISFEDFIKESKEQYAKSL